MEGWTEMGRNRKEGKEERKEGGREGGGGGGGGEEGREEERGRGRRQGKTCHIYGTCISSATVILQTPRLLFISSRDLLQLLLEGTHYSREVLFKVSMNNEARKRIGALCTNL